MKTEKEIKEKIEKLMKSEDFEIGERLTYGEIKSLEWVLGIRNGEE